MGVDLSTIAISAPISPLSRLNSELLMMSLDFVKDVRTAVAHRDLRTSVETLIQRKWKHFDFTLMPYVRETLPPMQPPMAVRLPTTCQDLKMVYEGIHARCREMGKAFLAVHAKNHMKRSFEPAGFLALERAAKQAENDRNLVRIWPRITGALRIRFEYKNSSEIRAWLTQNRDELARINILDLSNLKLTMIPKEFSSLPLPNLLHLNLSNNCLQTLPTRFGAHWPILNWLELDHNRLGELPSDFGEGWPLIESVDLSFNELDTLPEHFSRNWPALQDLDLENNVFKALPDDFGANWNRLRRLWLENNQLRALPANLGANWPWWNVLREDSLAGNPLLDPPPLPPREPEKPWLTAMALNALSTALLAGFSAYLFGWRPTCSVGAIYLMHRYANRS
jgi:hypothetical protein